MQRSLFVQHDMSQESSMKYISNLPLEALVWFQTPRKRGVTAIEYGLLAALISVVIITAVTLLGTNLNAVFNSIAGKLKG
jgi:pilus assembly protein Flp/PilA